VRPGHDLILGVILFATVAAAAQVASPTGQSTPVDGAPRRPQMAPVGVPVLGMPFVHDPSTVVRFHGRYYVFSTGRGIPFYSSPDGETWTREGSVFEKIPDDVHASVPKNDGVGVWAPDIIRVGGQFYLYYAVSSWGSFQSAIGLATNPVLDPKDPAYKWKDRGVVVTSNGTEELNAIDPGVMRAPDGTLWLCYGSYHGSIRVTQLNPKTGLGLEPGKLGAAIATADRSEASDMIFHDGYYYLFVNHDSCCKGKNSEYNIRVGRSKSVTGPYVDKHGEPMTAGGGSLFLAAREPRIGPGHFGLVTDYDAPPDGAERFSVHYEADLTRGGRSVLDIRPLLWSQDGWPVAGENLADGTYQIVSRQSEYMLQQAAGGSAELRVGHYLALDNQKWTIAAMGGGWSKMVNAGSGDALGVTDGAAAAGPYTGGDGQLWKLEEFPDGAYRIWNKASGLSLTAAGRGGVAAQTFAHDDAHLWTIMTP
jgi:arabinan endo-1,5-alpha-L-arabinosidase